MKELYIAGHEQLIEEYLNEHEGADWTEAYEATADAAYNHMQEMCAARADYERMKRKESQ